MLKLACSANNCAFAVAFDCLRAAERGSQILSHRKPKRLQVVHEAGDLFDITPGEGVVNDGDDRTTLERGFGGRAAFVKDLFDSDDSFSDCNLRHELELAVRISSDWL